MKNYSRQRSAVLEVLRSTDIHPTAAEIYERVRVLIPNISLGTVYRNLADLRNSGEILSLSVGDGVEHFDGDNTPHLHLHCKKCGKITDVQIENDCITETAKKNSFVPETVMYIADGICKACNQREISDNL